MRIPSVVRGLESLHTERGSLPWNKVIEPAETLAKDGFVVTKHFYEELTRINDHGLIFPYLEPGKILKIPHLGETFEAIKHGSQRNYK